MNVTRTTNQNGTYRYEIDGEVQYKASKVLYTHVSRYTNDAVTFHKTEAAANRAKGYKYWTKAEVLTIVDGDAVTAAPATPGVPETPAAPAPAAKPTVKIMVTEEVRNGHVLVSRDGERLEVIQYATAWDARTNKLDPGARTFHLQDENGKIRVYKARLGRRLRVAK